MTVCRPHTFSPRRRDRKYIAIRPYGTMEYWKPLLNSFEINPIYSRLPNIIFYKQGILTGIVWERLNQSSVLTMVEI